MSSAEKGKKVFGNGDVYTGTSENGIIAGVGLYEWSDGSKYNGEWKRGKKHGHGHYTWTSGSTYTGQWRKGYMQGFGTFKGSDGSSYSGNWHNDRNHGLGRKEFPNGDIYDGLWKLGVAEGPGTYKWLNGNEYDGEWSKGYMDGRGTFVWSSGERYDGDWKGSQPHGSGIYKWPDGSVYEGTWRKGVKDGVGIWFSPARDADSTTSSSKGRRSSAATTMDKAKSTPRSRNQSIIKMTGATGETSATTVDPQSPEVERNVKDGEPGMRQLAIVRLYEGGVLLKERKMLAADLKYSNYMKSQAPAKIKAQTLKKAGETIYKGHRSYDLMLDLQLGIRISLTRSNAEPSRRLLERDLNEKVKELFPREGSPTTPPHPTSDFKWRDYSPLAFRELRESCGVNAGEYMLSICGDKALRELSSPGKSGSVFYISHDDRYLIKTMRKAEMKLLQEYLPQYYKHMATYTDSLLPKFFGLHVVKPRNGRKVRFVVMKNLFGDLPINLRYDLKGATYGRETPMTKRKESSTLKDLDLEYSFVLDQTERERVMKQLRIDCALLESIKVMDYSVLLGIHLCEPDEAYTKSLQGSMRLSENGSFGSNPNMSSNEVVIGQGDDLTVKLAFRDSEDGSIADNLDDFHFGSSKDSTTSRELQFHSIESSNSLTDSFSHDRLSNLHEKKPLVEIGYAMKAKAYMKHLNEMNALARQSSNLAAQRKFRQEKKGSSTLDMGEKSRSLKAVEEPKNVILYFGIIDILQEYNSVKQAETFYKGIVGKRTEISSVDPKFYASRFLAFMSGIFEKEDEEGKSHSVVNGES